MLPDKYRKVHRCLPLVMGVVFATTYSIPISGQPRIPTPSQSPTTENPSASGTQQPVQAFGGQIAMFVGHENSIHSAVFSPDGRQILTASSDNTARLWDRKGNLLAVLRGHKDGIGSAVFSSDGQQILTASGDRTARLWDIKGNLLAVLRGHEGYVRRAVFSSDGRQILTASNDHTARLWDSKGNLLTVLRGHEGHVSRAAFSPDGQQILTGSQDDSVRLWDRKGNLLAVLEGGGAELAGGIASAEFSPDGQQILTTWYKSPHALLWDSKGNPLAALQDDINATITNAKFSPDGRHILTAGSNGARLWDHQGNLLAVVGDDYIFAYLPEFSPDGRHILTASVQDKTARLWDRKGNLLAVFRGHDYFITAKFSPDGRQILTANDHIPRLWDVSDVIAAQSEQMTALQAFQEGVTQNNAQLAVLQGHKDLVTSAVFSPNGQQILTASTDHTARLWDRQGNLLAVLGPESWTQNVKFSPDGRHILSDSIDTATLWDSQGNLLAVLRHEKKITSAEFSPDGRQILTASEDKTARLWDRQGNLLAVLRHEDSVTSAEFSPDGRQILTASEDKTARLWDRQGNLLAVFEGHEKGITSAEFSPDGRQILTTSEDKTAQLWDTQGNLLAVLRHENGITHAEFSPDSRQILTISEDKTAQLRDVSNAIAAQSEQMTALQAFQGGVSKNNAQLAVLGDDNTSAFRAKFSPDGQQILALSNDQTARLWDRKGNLLALLRHENGITSAEFSPDGRQILTTSHNNTAQLWDRQGNLLAVLRAHEDEVNSALSPDDQQILTASNNYKIARLWDGQGNLLAVFGGHDGLVRIAKFSPDGQQILTIGSDKNDSGTNDKTPMLWDLQGNLLAVLRGHEEEVESAVFSPDGQQILTIGSDKTPMLWDRQGNLLAVLRGHEDGFAITKFSPDGRHILITTIEAINPPVRLWDRQGNLVAVFWPHKNMVKSTAEFSPDSREILTTAINDKTARLWDLQGNLLAVLQGHKDSVTSAVFSPNGQQILTASTDHTARLWDSKGNLLAVFWGHEEEVESAVFSPDGSEILTSSKDSTARLWDISTGIKVSAAEVAFIKGNQLSTQGTIESRLLALQKLEEALALYRTDRKYAQATLTLLSMGGIYANFGQFQSALDCYNQALSLSKQAGAKAEEAAIINSFGQLYTALSDPKSALNYYNQALPLFYQLNDQGAVANTLNNIGDIHAAAGNWKNALDSYNKALVISRPAGNLAAEATALTGIGSTYIASKEWSTALNAYNQALKISRHLNDKVKETTVLNQMGKIQAALGQNSTALENYNQALSLSQQLGYKTEEAHIIYNQALLNRQQNNLTVAQTEIETAINIIENLRTQIGSQELRQSYFARNQDYYQFYIDLLMQLHRKNPDKGYDAQAFHASERARARSLLELLSEASANIRQGVDPQLLAQEQNLQQQLSDFQTRKYQIVSAQSTQEALDEIQQKIDTVLKELAQIEAKIRASSPRYAALKYPEPLNLQQIQQQVIDDNTLLLEYSLGEERSYLWAVTKTSFTSYELPSRTEIETTAKNFRDTLTKPTTRTSPQMVAESAALLSQTILAPVASELGNKRLLIVADGALQYIPFGALTLEKSEAPLIVKHEIVNLPSASTLAILRRDMATRQPAPKAIALFADPVFSPDDERLKGISTSPVTKNQTVENLPVEAQQLQRSASEANIYWKRLPATRTEAEQILALVPDDLEKPAFDFTANRTAATDPDLSQYRIVHFATHGFANSKHPELSGLVLSLVDEKGTLQNGYLRLNDIFNLNLPAELVVLSACQTGLGKDVKGEGLVGLTRGFMYAGAPRVVVSLWSVEDQATSDLMTRFYKKMLQDKLSPAAALRSAQIEVLQLSEWQSPYYWAAFGLQGEWN